MGGRKKAKGRGRQNQSRNRNHNQVVKQPTKGQSSDQHSDTDSQANTVEKEDVSCESSSNDQCEDVLAQAVDLQETVNQLELEVKDDEPKEESHLKDANSDCSTGQDGGTGILYKEVSSQYVLKLLKPDESFINDEEQDQIQIQGGEDHSFNEQKTIRDASNESSPLKSTVEQSYIENGTDDQLQEESVQSFASQNLFAQITVNSPYKRELEEYSPHRRDKRPIKLLRIETDCKMCSNNQHEVMQEQQDNKCQDDQLSLDEQEYNKEFHNQEDCQQMCSQRVQDDMDNQLITVKMHEGHHTEEDEFYNIEQKQFSDQQKQQYDADQNEEAEIEDKKEFESKQKEQVIANQIEVDAKKNEKIDTIQNIQLNVNQDDHDATEQNKELGTQGTEWYETKQSECLNVKQYKKLNNKVNEFVAKQNEELSAQQNELEIKLNESFDSKQVKQVHTRLNEELVAKQSGDEVNAAKENEHTIKLNDEVVSKQIELVEYELNVNPDAKLNEKVISRFHEVNDKVKEHDTKLYERHKGEHTDKHDSKTSEDLNIKQNEHLDVKHNDIDVKVGIEQSFPDQKEWLEKLREEYEAKKNEKTIVELCKELNVKVKEHSGKLYEQANSKHDFKINNELGTSKIEKFDGEDNKKFDIKVNNEEREELYVKKHEELDIRDDNAKHNKLVKPNEKLPIKMNEQKFIMERKRLDTKEIITLSVQESLKVDTIQNCLLDSKQNTDDSNEIEQKGKHSESVDSKANETDAKLKEHHIIKQKDKLDDEQSIHFHERESEEYVTKHIDHLNTEVQKHTKLKEEQYAKQIEELDSQNEQPCGKQTDKFDFKVKPDIKQSEGSDTKLIEKMNIEVKNGIQNEIIPEPDEELNDLEDQQHIRKEGKEIRVQEKAELYIRQDDQLTDKQYAVITVQHNEKLEGKKMKELDAKKNFDEKIDTFLTKQNQQLNGKHEKIDVLPNRKMHSKAHQGMDVKVNYVKQNEHYTSRENEEFINGKIEHHHVKNYENVNLKENEDIETEHIEKLDHKQIQYSNSKQCQEISFLDKQKQDFDDIQNQKFDDEQAQELYTRHDKDLEAKDISEVDNWQNQKVECSHCKVPFPQQFDKNAFKECEDCNIKSNKPHDIIQNEKYQNGKEDEQLFEGKQNEFCDTENPIDKQQGEKQECMPKEEKSQEDYGPNNYQHNMIKTLESQNSSESNKYLKQEDPEFNKITDTGNNHKYEEFHQNMKFVKNCDHKHCDCRSQQINKLAVEQNEVCGGKQSKTINSKKYEEYESEGANQLQAGKQNEHNSVNGLVTHHQEKFQECDCDEDNPQQGHVPNNSQHDVSQKNSLMNREQKLNSVLNNVTFTNDHQDKDIQQSRIEPDDNCQDEKDGKLRSSKPKDQQHEVIEINQHKTDIQEGEQKLQNTFSLEEHQFHASGQTENDNKEIKVKESKQEEKQEIKQDGEQKSFYKYGNHQSASKQDHVIRGNRSNPFAGKRQYYSWKSHHMGYNNHNNYYESYGYQNTQNHLKGYQHEHQRKRDQNYHRAQRSWQNNQSHYQQQQIKLLGTYQSGGLVCGICEDKYNHRTKLPRNLFCGHSVCTSCAQKLIKYNTIQCPYCKVKTLRVHSSNKLSINFPLMTFLNDETAAKPVESVSGSVEIESQAHSTEVGATGVQQYQSSLNHAEKSIVTVRNAELMGSQQYCDLKHSTGESLSPPFEQSPHNSLCLEVGVHPTAHCAGCDQWVCDACGRIDHFEKKGCTLIPLEEALIQMKQEKENNLKIINESISKSLKEIRDYSDQLDILLLSMGAAFDCLGKEQQSIRKTLQEGLEMRKNLEVLESKLPPVNSIAELLVYFQAVESDCAVARHWISDRSSRSIDNDKIKKTGKALISITLQSLMTSTTENGLVSQIVACQEMPSGKKFSQLTVKDGRMHLHSLSGITRLKEAQTLPLECFKVCLDSTSTLAYLDLFWNSSFQGRVYIRLTGNTVRGRQFLSLCIGERGPTLRNTHFHRVWWKGLPGEHIWGGDYDQGDGSGDVAITNICNSADAECESDRAVPITPGLVGGRYEKKNISSIFRIYTREAKHGMEETAFGYVECGLDVVEKAISHNNIQDVIISDCGIVMEM